MFWLPWWLKMGLSVHASRFKRISVLEYVWMSMGAQLGCVCLACELLTKYLSKSTVGNTGRACNSKVNMNGSGVSMFSNVLKRSEFGVGQLIEFGGRVVSVVSFVYVVVLRLRVCWHIHPDRFWFVYVVYRPGVSVKYFGERLVCVRDMRVADRVIDEWFWSGRVHVKQIGDNFIGCGLFF